MIPASNVVRTSLATAPVSRRKSLALEVIALAQVGVLVISATWALGGNTAWAQTWLSVWGSLALPITFLAARDRASVRPLRLLWPLALLNAVVAVSTFNPSFRAVADGASLVYVPIQSLSSLPSAARPTLSLQALWFFDAVYLSCFNLSLVVRRRRALRVLLLAVVGNAAVLAIFGTVQKLANAPGLFFGAVKSPQVFFFASFIYHNHWGAFVVLAVAIALGLVAHFAQVSGREFWHSPGFAGIVAIVLLAASVPLSSSRSCTILVALLLSGALVQGLVHLWRSRRRSSSALIYSLTGGLVALVFVGVFIYQLDRPVIEQRLATTREQLSTLQSRGNLGSRAILYRDTWNLAQEKIWFGWGMASFPTAFFQRNSQVHASSDGLPMYFHDAHSDWLQSVAEVGLVGTVLLGLCALMPWFSARRALCSSPLPLYLLVGCGLLLLYAWIEFPFGNRAVVATFWMTFFSALQYARLEAIADAPA